MKKINIACAGAIVLMLSGCISSNSEDSDAQAERSTVARAQDKSYIEFEGVVVYSSIEGGFYGLQAGSSRYDPEQLPKEFCKNGLKVSVKAHLRDTPSVRQWGQKVQVISIKVVEQKTSE